jgi:hypothetical protein
MCWPGQDGGPVAATLDLTARLFAQPRGGWIGFDTTVSLGPTGLGLAHGVLYDTDGPFGTVSRCLTV